MANLCRKDQGVLVSCGRTREKGRCTPVRFLPFPSLPMKLWLISGLISRSPRHGRTDRRRERYGRRSLRGADPQARAEVPHHDFRRGNARQLQPHFAFFGPGRRKRGGRDCLEQPGVVPEARHHAAAGRADRGRGPGLEDGDRRRRQRHLLRQAPAGHRKHAVRAAIDGVEKEGVYTFRNLDDARALVEQAQPGRKAAVIGGGLLGLEAARGLQVRGCDVTVVHLLDTLMNMQLDATGGRYLEAKMQQLGVRVLLNRITTRVLGESRAEGLEFRGGERIEADLVVIAAGIRPNAHLGKKAGLKVNRGIVVNDYLETSHPDIFAVGECVEHRGVVYGLVAPLVEQGKVLAATITGNRGPQFQGAQPAAKLKIMGVDVFSAGQVMESDGVEVVRYEDPAMGIYQKLLCRENKLVGVVLVGDAGDSHRYVDWLRSGADLAGKRRHLLFPEPAADGGLDAAQMPDSDTVCGCMGVTKGAIISAIHEKGLNTLAQLKECTRASTGCGSCTNLCQQLLRAVAPDFEEDKKKVLCGCVPFTQENLREMVRTQRLRSVQEILEIYGNGAGCEICKPALSYMVDMVWCGDHEEDRSARFINDRVHANIQRDGTFSVVPRMRGGVTTPAELRRIADVAEKYHVRMVKVTGSQRIDLLGVKKSDLPKIWADLGMPSGQAYTKGVRMVKTCVGTEFCRFGTQDSIHAGVELERRLENLYTPHKVKMGAVGCPRNCAEATVKDIGLVGQEGSWQVVVGGAAGKHV